MTPLIVVYTVSQRDSVTVRPRCPLSTQTVYTVKEKFVCLFVLRPVSPGRSSGSKSKVTLSLYVHKFAT